MSRQLPFASGTVSARDERLVSAEQALRDLDELEPCEAAYSFESLYELRTVGSPSRSTGRYRSWPAKFERILDDCLIARWDRP